jgi:hypothetical protein
MPDEIPNRHVQARARQYLAALAKDLEPDWGDVAPGNPVLVQTLEALPAYWVVPLLDGDATVGILRLTLDGELISLGPSPKQELMMPTGFDSEKALQRAKATIADRTGAYLSPPRLVTYGYRGREAWLIEVHEHGQALRRLLIWSDAANGIESVP